MSSRRNRRKWPHRPAVGLVEAISLVALVGTILSLSAVVINRAYLAHHHALAHFRHTEQLQRLGERWRRDVARAVRIEIADALDALVLHLDDRESISYRQTADSITRSMSSNAVVTASEQWTIPRGAQIRYSLDTDGAQPLVTGRIVYGSDSSWLPVEWVACAVAAVPSDTSEQITEPDDV